MTDQIELRIETIEVVMLVSIRYSRILCGTASVHGQAVQKVDSFLNYLIAKFVPSDKFSWEEYHTIPDFLLHYYLSDIINTTHTCRVIRIRCPSQYTKSISNLYFSWLLKQYCDHIPKHMALSERNRRPVTCHIKRTIICDQYSHE